MRSPLRPLTSRSSACEDLTAGYGDVVLLENVSFDVRRGEVFVILGGSGSGKSTLLKHMIGLLSAAAGSVVIDGDDIVDRRGRRDARAILRKIGVMYQAGALFGSMTLLENVRLPLEEYTELAGRRDRADRADEAGARRARGVHRPPAGGDLRRHAEARRDRAGDGARPDRSCSWTSRRRASIRSRRPSSTRLILRLAAESRHDVRRRHARTPSIFTIADRVIMLDRTQEGHHRRGRSAQAARRERRSVGAPVLQPRGRARRRMKTPE